MPAWLIALLSDLPQLLALIDQIIAFFQGLNPTPATTATIKNLQALKASLTAQAAEQKKP